MLKDMAIEHKFMLALFALYVVYELGTRLIG